MTTEEEDDELPDFSNDPTFKNFWSRTVYGADCPNCDKTNYWTQGSKWDTEVLECWNCGKKAWVCSDARDELQHMYESMDDAMDEKGRETP